MSVVHDGHAFKIALSYLMNNHSYCQVAAVALLLAKWGLVSAGAQGD